MDRLTQLQMVVDRMTEIFYTSVGVLQRDAPLAKTDFEVECWTQEEIDANTKSNKELAQNAAKDLAEADKICEFLIQSLPGLDTTEEEQYKRLKDLELENEIEGRRLDDAIRQAEAMKAKIDLVLEQIIDKEIQFFHYLPNVSVSV
ncbi:hypothetical protein EDD86DRAFT_193355 [Gorgonomyces haynaldii]|nr:hypothetical protein EDD86DRAFT_193355 [Gorgonomyces haynaldii]